MLTSTKALLGVALAAAGMASQASAATTFTVDNTRSALNISIVIDDPLALMSSGSGSSPVTGTLVADIGSTGYALNQIRITDLDLATSPISITLKHSMFGYTVSTVTTTALTLKMNESGAGAAVPITGDPFTQTNNLITTTGSATVSLGSLFMSLDDSYHTDFENVTITDGGASGAGHLMTISVPLNVSQPINESGATGIINIVGTLVATGVYTPVPEVASLAILAGAPLLMMRRSRKM